MGIKNILTTCGIIGRIRKGSRIFEGLPDKDKREY